MLSLRIDAAKANNDYKGGALDEENQGFEVFTPV